MWRECICAELWAGISSTWKSSNADWFHLYDLTVDMVYRSYNAFQMCALAEQSIQPNYLTSRTLARMPTIATRTRYLPLQHPSLQIILRHLHTYKNIVLYTVQNDITFWLVPSTLRPIWKLVLVDVGANDSGRDNFILFILTFNRKSACR